MRDMETYVVVSVKPVEVRVGDQSASKIKTFSKGEKFTTHSTFAADLLSLKYVRKAEGKVADGRATTQKSTKSEGGK